MQKLIKELSQERLQSYKAKATSQARSVDHKGQTFNKRVKGIIRAARKLHEAEEHEGAWQFPSEQNQEQEYNVEYQHHLKHSTGEIFPTVHHWKNAIKNGKVVDVTPEFDRKISGRSHTSNKEQLHGLISGYRSYPQFRNAKTLDNLYDRLQNKKPLDMPMVFKHKDGRHSIISGNTRMDAARHVGVPVKALVINHPDLKENVNVKEGISLNDVFKAHQKDKEHAENVKKAEHDSIRGKWHINHPLHREAQELAASERRYSMGAANYHHVFSKGDDKQTEREFEKHVRPHFEKRGYPEKGTPEYYEGQKAVISSWRTAKKGDVT